MHAVLALQDLELSPLGRPFVLVPWCAINLARAREPKRQVWFYAFARGFLILDGPEPQRVMVPWHRITAVRKIWTSQFDPNSEQSTPVVAAYEVDLSDGTTRTVTRAFRNVIDPYAETGGLLRRLLPEPVASSIPLLPTIDQIMDDYAGAR